MGTAHDHENGLLSPLEQHIVELVDELNAAIARLGEDEDGALPLVEFDQRLLLEHTQVVARYILAQAAARAYPELYRLIGQASPGNGATVAADHKHHHDHDHEDENHQHHVADPEAARAAHRSGRAIIGEHPWEHEHDHGDGHGHADEWAWEPIAADPPADGA